MQNCGMSFGHDFHSAFILPHFAFQLQAGVDIGGNVPDVVLHVGVLIFQSHLHLADGVEHRGVIPGKFLADVRQA